MVAAARREIRYLGEFNETFIILNIIIIIIIVVLLSNVLLLLLTIAAKVKLFYCICLFLII